MLLQLKSPILNKRAVDKIVSEFYNNHGWSEKNITEDGSSWEDLIAY